MAVDLAKRRFTVGEYYRMAEAGILGEDDRVELIDGEIVEMSPIGVRHAACVLRLTHLCARIFGDAALVNIQNPIRLGEYAEPQPDLALLRPRADFYASAYPTAEHVFLVIEVAETSARVDRRVKAPLYARNGIAETWLVDLGRGVIVVFRDPTPSGYRTSRTVRRGERLAPLAFPDRELDAEEILGPA